LLRHHIDPARYAYTGIDISRVAIQRAASRQPSMALIVADAAQFPNYVRAKYEAVIFNEVLYYVSDVPGLLNAYSGLLSGRAMVIVSTFLPAADHREWFDRVEIVWQALSHCSWALLDDCELWNKTSGNRWRIAAFQSNGRRNL
jgi:2-polyprenyl-3-methyl-5-hydroxy-6-metoxy-1,4-benzoquinol methylase